jgi:hypothetical protein
VELARPAENGYTIDQYHPDLENYDPDGHRDEVVEAQLGAAFFNERGPPLRRPGLPQEDLPRDPQVLEARARHNRIDVAGALYPCAGV